MVDLTFFPGIQVDNFFKHRGSSLFLRIYFLNEVELHNYVE
jgi:hypothetical protein